LGEVKLGELGSWIGRRNFSLSAIRGAVGRAVWRYRFKYLEPKRSNAAFIYHFMLATFTLNYFIYEYPVRSKNLLMNTNQNKIANSKLLFLFYFFQEHHTWAIYH
jgi:hypothetical protein